MNKIPVSVIVVTKNEQARLGRCLQALQQFDEIVVLDSDSTDATKGIAFSNNARVENFTWNGQYPKKRQWALDNLKLKHDRVFFVDADEIIPPLLAYEISKLEWRAAGYFVRGKYVFGGKKLNFGLRNSKLAIFDRREMHFPVVDDLDIPGMGELEGHYQPVLKTDNYIGRIRQCLIHEAYNSSWRARHERYALWEAGMNAKNAWPSENSPVRNAMKKIFRAVPLRPLVAFLYSYVWKFGFLDGAAGFNFARSRASYYQMISRASKAQAQSGVPSTPRLAADK
jgi:glycosyltransferase involved in cell wall biosynthesis